MNIGTDSNIMVHFLPYLGMSTLVRGPVVKAPKFMRAQPSSVALYLTPSDGHTQQSRSWQTAGGG